MDKLIQSLLTLTLVAVVALPMAPQAAAQESEDTAVRIEIRDGKVIINGSKVAELTGDQIRIVKENGEEVTVSVGDDGNMVWVVDDEEVGSSGAPNAFFFRGDGEGFAFGPGGDAMRELFRDRADGPNVWFDSDGDHGERHRDQNVFRLRGDHDMALEMFDRARGPMPFAFPEQREVLRMEREINELGRQVRRAEGEERVQLEARLDEMLDEAFDQKIEMERRQADELQERLAHIQQRVDERSAARERIIERRKRSLLGERDLLDW